MKVRLANKHVAQIGDLVRYAKHRSDLRELDPDFVGRIVEIREPFGKGNGVRAVVVAEGPDGRERRALNSNLAGWRRPTGSAV